MRKFNTFFIVAILAAFSFVHSASAVPTTYTSRSAWEAAGGLPVVGSGFEMDALQSLSGTVPLVDFTLNYVGNTSALNKIVSRSFPVNNIESRHLDGFVTNYAPIGPQAIEIEFSMPLKAFGADFDQANNNGMGMIVNGTMVDFSGLLGSAATDDDNGFIGVVDNTPFTSVTLVMTGGNAFQGEFFRLDNVSSMIFVPEPGSLSLLFTGCIGLLGLRRRR